MNFDLSARDGLIASDTLLDFEILVRELGGDPVGALARCEIDARRLGRPGDKIGLRAMADLVESTACALGCTDFGMRLAERQRGTAMMKPLDRLISSAPTFGAATLSAIRHMDVYSAAIRETLEYDRAKNLFRLRFDFRPEHLRLSPQLLEQTALLVHNAAQSLTGGAARAREVWFSHRRLSPPDAYRARFGTTVRFGQDCDAIFFSGEDLRAPVVSSDGVTHRREQASILAEFGLMAPDVEVAVRDFVRDNLARKAVTRTEVAEHVGLSTRTLHRRLRAIGWTFDSLRDDVRRRLAIRYLTRSELTLTQVAALLGYSEQAVFCRSCQRWFSSTPAALRRGLRQEHLLE